MKSKSFSQIIKDYVDSITGNTPTITSTITTTPCSGCGSTSGCSCTSITVPTTVPTIGPYSTGTTVTIGGFIGLTVEEKAELEALREQHKAESKALKLQEFKQLHSEIRQTIVSLLFFAECVDKMNTISSNKPARLQELESKDWLNMASIRGIAVGNFHINLGMILPEGLTKEDLIKAHSEACMEEQLDG